jgi:hypothetical protein
MRRIVPLALVAVAFGALQWLRWPEPPGLDQSLFGFYGSWLGRGLRLYADLWDSKPPGIFLAYAAAARGFGVEHAAWSLDAAAAAAAGVLAYRLARALALDAGQGARGASVAGWASGLVAAWLPSAPVFEGPHVAAQPELLMAPLLFAAAFAARASGTQGRARHAALLAGLLLGGATCLKLIGVLLLPILWAVAPAEVRRTRRYTMRVLAGWALPVAVTVVALAAAGTLAEAVQATIAYPRAYAAVIASRMPLVLALEHAGSRLARGLPLLIVLAAWGAVATRPGALFMWLGLAAAGVLLQRQAAGYQLYALVPPLVLLAGHGAAACFAAVVRSFTRARRVRACSF